MKRLLPNCWQDWLILGVVGSAILLMLVGCSVQWGHNYRMDWWGKHNSRTIVETNTTTLP